MARRTVVEIAFDGVDITGSIQPYLESFVYTDNEADEADDIQIKLQDRDSLWLESWLEQAIQAAAAARLKIDGVILQKNWKGDGQDLMLPCGECELDTVDYSAPPARITIKGTALPFSSGVRQTKKSRAWENSSLSAIARQIAGENRMGCLTEFAQDPFYRRTEQAEETDIRFLARLCRQAGLCLKATNRLLVLFDRAAYEKKAPVAAIQKGDGSYSICRLTVSSAESQYTSCRVRCTDPDTGQCIEGIARIPDYKEEAKNNRQLEIWAKAESRGQAEELAEKQLRLHNSYFKTAQFTMPGNPLMAAGCMVRLKGWGAFDGSYRISQARHRVDSSGYTTQVRLQKAWEGI